MRHRVLWRVGSLLTLLVLVLTLALSRTGILTLNPNGTFGTTLIIASVAALLKLLSDRTTYLPFLGDCVLPSTVLYARTPDKASVIINVKVPAGATHVMYWASESGAGIVPNPFDAYGNYANAGVVEATADGMATLKIRCPSQYTVRGRTMPRHVHYRAVYKSGIAGPVETVNVVCL